MRAACPTPVSVVEEDIPGARSVGGFQSPVCYSRTRVTKGFTCRRPSFSPSEGRDTPLSPTTNIRGTGLMKSRPYYSELFGLGAAPATPLPSPRNEEAAQAMSRDYEVQSLIDWGTSTESEGEEEEGVYSLSVTGRNPVLSESNVIYGRPPFPMRLPTKAVSAEHQSLSPINREESPLNRRSKVLPMKSLNIGGLGLPFPVSESHRASAKDYKPGRIVHSAFDCFRCEHRMSVHDAHEWFESILISSRVRGARRDEKAKEKANGKDRKYSKDEISRALYPRYWSKQCLSPDPRPRSQMKTPNTRPPTQTPDTISGPWRAGCSRADSRDGILFGQLTREDLRGFCGGHEKSKCPSGIPHDPRPTPCRPYYSDTQLGVSCNDLWCHNADVRVENYPGNKEVDSHATDSLSRNNMSRLSQSGKVSRLSVHSWDGHPTGRTSACEYRMSINCENPEDVFYELHEEEECDEHYDEGVAAAQLDYSLTPSQMRRQCESCCHGQDYQQRDEVEDQSDDPVRSCCSRTNTTPTRCSSRCSTLTDDHDDGCVRRRLCSRVTCCSADDTNQRCCHSRTSTLTEKHCDDALTNRHLSQIDCNTSAVEPSPSLAVKGTKTGTGVTVRDVRRDLCKDSLNSNQRKLVMSPCRRQCREAEVDAPEDSLADEPYLENENENFVNENQDEEEEDGEEEEREDQQLLDERDSCFFRSICEGAITKNENNQTYPDLPKPLGRYFCYVPIVDKRYNRWRRRKPKKRKRAAAKVRNSGGKTSCSTSDESTTGTDGRESKRGKPIRKNGTGSRARRRRLASRNEERDQDVYEESIELQFEPVFDQSDWAEDTQFPDSTEACTDSSKSSLTSSDTGASTEPNVQESFTTPCPVTFVDITELSKSVTTAPAVGNDNRAPGTASTPELVLEQTRARSRVASIPSKNHPRTQKSLLSLSLRGPSVEKEMATVDPMQALPRTGSRGLPLLKTQRSVLARSSEGTMTRFPSNVSYLSGMERRLGWIKRGIMQKSSNQAIIPLPKTELKLAAERFAMSPSPKSPVPKTRISKGFTKSTSTIPRHSKTSTAETFSPIIRGQQKPSSSKRRRGHRRSSRHDMMSTYVADEEEEDYRTFTLKDLLSTLPETSDTKIATKRQYNKYGSKKTPPHKLSSFFNNFVKGSQLHQRKLHRPEMDRSISALSFTPAFTFSIYTLPEVYRSHNITIDKAAQ